MAQCSRALKDFECNERIKIFGASSGFFLVNSGW